MDENSTAPSAKNCLCQEAPHEKLTFGLILAAALAGSDAQGQTADINERLDRLEKRLDRQDAQNREMLENLLLLTGALWVV